MTSARTAVASLALLALAVGCRDSRTVTANPEVYVPAGSFSMGCHPEDGACDAAESPYHEVAMSAFFIDRTETTQAEYGACVAAGACTPPLGRGPACDAPDRGAYPQTCVSWVQARAFCQWNGKDLPTEAQWEKAARGTDGRIYPWGNATPTCERSNHGGCAAALDPADSHPLGASPYGALNMAGNAGEFVADWWDPAYYAAPAALGPDPLGPASGVNDGFVLRGAGFGFSDAYNRTSWRSGIGPKISGWASDYGFRCARAAR
jgi:formylglycine-generating enzyme required for sulfatase activity